MDKSLVEYNLIQSVDKCVCAYALNCVLLDVFLHEWMIKNTIVKFETRSVSPILSFLYTLKLHTSLNPQSECPARMVDQLSKLRCYCFFVFLNHDLNLKAYIM